MCSRVLHTAECCISVTWFAGAGIFVSVSNLPGINGLHLRTVPCVHMLLQNCKWFSHQLSSWRPAAI